MHFQNLIIVLVVIFTNAAAGDDLGDRIESQLAMAGGNKPQIERALVEAPADQRPSMRFLVAWMPSEDLRQLTADRLLENVALATQVRTMTMWQHTIPDEIFNNFVLPHACLDEARDPWRSDFHERFWPFVKDSKSASEAAQALNQRVFQELNVKYSTDRRRANQSPAESIKLGLASCSGLSIILVDACRSVGVPARIAGIPKWANKNGNHTWVEVWDNGWHFTGAAEYDSRGLDHAWFTSDAALADSSSQLSSIYSVKYEATGLHFPLSWNLQDDSIHAVNVTERYVNKRIDLPKGFARILFSAKDNTGKRIALAVRISAQQKSSSPSDDTDNSSGKLHGMTRNETRDTNDFLEAVLEKGKTYQIIASDEGSHSKSWEFTTTNEDQQFVDWSWDAASSKPNDKLNP